MNSHKAKRYPQPPLRCSKARSSAPGGAGPGKSLKRRALDIRPVVGCIAQTRIFCIDDELFASGAISCPAEPPLRERSAPRPLRFGTFPHNETRSVALQGIPPLRRVNTSRSTTAPADHLQGHQGRRMVTGKADMPIPPRRGEQPGEPSPLTSQKSTVSRLPGESHVVRVQTV